MLIGVSCALATGIIWSSSLADAPYGVGCEPDVTASTSSHPSAAGQAGSPTRTTCSAHRWRVGWHRRVGDSLFALVTGALIVAHDGTLLGRITRDIDDPESLANPSSKHRIDWNVLSLLNESGPYGCPNGALSAFNPGTSTPPIVVLNGVTVGYLTVNRELSPRVDPVALLLWLGVER
jgi:hypothetical protein